MAMSRTYGKLEIPMIGEDEPVFILRGQDILAHSAIEMYRLLAEAHGCQVAQALTGEISCFRRWQGGRRRTSLARRDGVAGVVPLSPQVGSGRADGYVTDDTGAVAGGYESAGPTPAPPFLQWREEP